jgi:hypothetical protein
VGGLNRPNTLLVRAWFLGLAFGCLILFAPEGPKTPLVSREGWSAVGFFRCPKPSVLQLSSPLLDNPDLTLWRSWSPEIGPEPGRLESAPFDPPTFLSVPLIGYPAFTDIALYVECIADGRRLTMATGNPHEDWYERTLWMPRRWCHGRVRVVAASQSRTRYVGVGTPFRSSALSYLKESAPVLLLVHALAFAALLAPGWAIALWLRSRGMLPGPTSLAAIPLTALLGYGCFFVAYYGGVAASAAASLGVGWAGVTLWRKGRVAGLAAEPDNLLPLGLMFLYSLLCVLLLYLPDAGIGTWTATYRYWPAVWSSDNQLQQMVAEALYQNGPILGLFDPWKVSDRPPLLAGTLILLRPLWQTLLGIGSNARLYFYFHQVTGIVLSCFWVVPVWHLVRSVGQSARQTVGVVALVGSTGFTLFNSTYIWPKLIAGALALVCYLVLTDDGERYGSAAGVQRWVATGLCGGLSLMCHGGVFTGMLPLVPTALRRATHARPWHVLVGVAVFAAVLLPWTAWQHFEEPPGNALVKFAFAGTWGFGEERMSAWETVRRAYATITLDQWLNDRWNAARSLFGAYLDPLLFWMTRLPNEGALAGRLRLSDCLYFFPSLRFLNVGWLALCLLAWRPSVIRARPRPLRHMAWAGLAGVAVAVLALWRIHIVHTLSYLSVLLVTVALAVVLVSARSPLARMAVAAQLVYFLIVWVALPLRWAPQVRWDVAVFAVLALAFGWRLFRLATLVDEAEGPQALS